MTVDSFPGLPPFPEDVHCVDLPRVSFLKLCDGDEIEIDRFFQACKQWGFLYLDLRDSVQGSAVLHMVNQMLEIGEKVFELDLLEKNRYHMTKGNFDG